MYPAKMAGPIEMPFGMWAQVSPSNHVLDGGSGSSREVAILGWGRIRLIVKCREHEASAAGIQLARWRWRSPTPHGKRLPGILGGYFQPVEYIVDAYLAAYSG